MDAFAVLLALVPAATVKEQSKPSMKFQ